MVFYVCGAGLWFYELGAWHTAVYYGCFALHSLNLGMAYRSACTVHRAACSTHTCLLARLASRAQNGPCPFLYTSS